MDSQQQPGQFNPGQYDFIMNPEQQKKKLFSFKGGGKQRYIIMAVAAIGMLTILILLFGLLFGGGSGSKERLIGIAQQQTELIRVAEQGTKNATGTDAKSLAASIQLTMLSDKNAIKELMTKNGDKFKEKDLTGTPDSEVDSKLTAAQQNGTFDTIFTSIVKELLNDYKTDLSSAYDVASGPQTQQTLAQAYENANNIVETHTNN